MIISISQKIILRLFKMAVNQTEYRPKKVSVIKILVAEKYMWNLPKNMW